MSNTVVRKREVKETGEEGHQESLNKQDGNKKQNAKNKQQENGKKKEELIQHNNNNKQEDKNGEKPEEQEEHGLKDRIKEYIGSYIQAPQFVKDNVYIHSGYRINFDSFKDILKSLFMVHNEIVNIWSHFLGAILVVIFGIYLTTAFGNIDYLSWKQKLTNNVTDKLQPIYNEFKAFDQAINQRVIENIEILKQDYHLIENNLIQNFNSLVHELNQLKNEVTPINVDKILSKFQQFSLYEQIDLQKIQDLQKHVLEGINELKDDWITQIDSRQFDWIDFHLSDYMHSQEIENNNNNNNSNQIVNNKHIVSRWPIFVFLVTAFLCLLCSAAFHLFHAINPQYYKIFLRIDYAGVSLLISGSTFPMFYYGFFCQIELAYLYLISIGIASLVVFFVSLQDFIHTPKYFTMKSVMYGGLGIFAAVPLVHLIYYEIFNFSAIGNYSMANSLIYYALMGVCYLGGLTIYATRCPERYKPGQFDICGASHQLWHISILLAIVLTYIGSLINFYTRKMSLCPAH